jgi:N-acetyl-anhydromuramyl-L-alanine amidase AmpD
MVVKFGDIGSRVSEVQKLLSLLGYDLIVDGNFGNKTLRSVRAFQKKVNLTSDGIVGPKTLEALKASQKRTAKEDKNTITEKQYNSLEVIKTHQLESSQYVKQKTDKDKIFIHFTAGRKSAARTIAHWASDDPRIATAYVIGADDGKAYEAFHPDYWGWHLGVKGTNGALDRASIGIEICSLGPLKKVGGKYYAWPNNWKTEVPSEEVYELDKPFKGYKYYQAYTDEQIKTLEVLLEYLIENYKIPVQKSFDMSWFEFMPSLISNKTPGLWTHVNCRKDKLDSYPDYRLLEVLNKIAKKYNP